jgi:hypothetical protein
VREEFFHIEAMQASGPEGAHQTITHPIICDRAFSWFRVRQTDNKAGNNKMFIQGFELYGQLSLP